MGLKKGNQGELTNKAMIELAKLILEDAKKALDYREIYDQVADIKGYTENQKQANYAQFYTDLNIDGRFMAVGSDKWGLKRWYPAEQIDDEITAEPKKKKKKSRKRKPVEDKIEKEVDTEQADDTITDDDFSNEEDDDHYDETDDDLLDDEEFDEDEDEDEDEEEDQK